MTTTPSKLEYPSDKGHIDDGKNYLDVILWNMNVGPRARTRAVFVPRPKAGNFSTPAQTARQASVAAAPAVKRKGKTHTGIAIRRNGERQVKLHETATTWCASPHETYDKITGQRIGAPGRCRLLLSSITPIAKKGT